MRKFFKSLLVILIFITILKVLQISTNFMYNEELNSKLKGIASVVNKINLETPYEPYTVQEVAEAKVIAPIYEDVTACQYVGNTKSNMDADKITLIGSNQHNLLNSGLMELNGFGNWVYYENGNTYYAVALSSIYGVVGERFKITLDSGDVFFAIKLDEKADDEVDSCGSHSDGSIIEFVINREQLDSSGYYQGFNGGFQLYEPFRGSIVKIEREV